MDDATEFSESWIRWRRRVDLDEYAGRWRRMAAAGESVHGEADFVDRMVQDHRSKPASILDAGCGAGRVAAELARRGHAVTGVDNDPAMLAHARTHPEPVEWVASNLTTFTTDRRFDAIVMAGNILVFARADDRAAVVSNLARHLAPAGVLINGSSDDEVDQVERYDVDRYDQWCADAGLVAEVRHGGWDREAYRPGGYSVSVHRSVASN